MPMDAVFPIEPFEPTYNEIEYLGAKMIVEKISADHCQIVRIISTNPQDYLRSELQPGQLIKNSQI